MQPIDVRQPHDCGPTFGLSALRRTRRDGACTCSKRSYRHIVGVRIRNATGTAAILRRDGSLRISVALLWSRGCTGPSLGAQRGEQRVGSNCRVGGRTSHATAPRRRRPRPRRTRIRRIASVPSRRCSTLPQRSTFRNTRPKQLSLASIQSFIARTGQAPRGRDAPDGDGAFGARLTVEDEVDASSHEVDPLDIEADQCSAAEPGGSQQQQSPIAQSGEIAGTSCRHSGE
jgi:hypothetical protein